MPHAAGSCRSADGGRSGVCARIVRPDSPRRGSSAPAAVTSNGYVPVNPARICDTRSGSGLPCAGQTLGAGATLNVQVAGKGGVPASGASAAVLNVTVTGGSSNTQIRVYPVGGPVSNPVLNPAAGVTANNQTTVKLGTGGQISVRNSSGSIDVLVDVEGYYASAGSEFVSMTPTRIADTRSTSGKPYAGETLAASGTLNVQVGGVSGIPASATAAVLDVTVVRPPHGGWLALYPAGITRPQPASTMNYSASTNLTKEVTVRLGTSPAPHGAIKIYNASAGSTDLIVDVEGFYVPPAADQYVALTPARIADTRTGSGQPYAGHPITAGGTLTVQASGVGGVPAGADAVVVNFTVPSGTAASSYLVAYPAGTSPHPTATSIYWTGTDAFNESTIKLSSTGAFSVYNSSGTTDLVVDVLGYDAPPPPPPPPSNVPDPPGQCEFGSSSYDAVPDRFTSCSDTEWELYTYDTDANGGVHITGNLNLEDLQWNSYSGTSLTWTHGVQIKLDYIPDENLGTFKNGTNAVIRPTCATQAACTVTSTLGADWTQPQLLKSDSSITNAFTETDTGPASTGSTDPTQTMHPNLGITLTGQATADIPAWTFTDDVLNGRCDFYLKAGGDQSRGCVNDQFIPTLTLSIATYGASAAMIRWAQTQESGAWGLQTAIGGNPLHRLPGGGNRNLMCGTYFTQDPSINAALIPYDEDFDSCDEFPFAATYENPANPSLPGQPPKPPFPNGKACAQLAAVQVANPVGDKDHEAADWPTVTVYTTDGSPTPTGNEVCVRGHIPNYLNGLVGTAYSNFVQPPGASGTGPGQRVIDTDPFWISVTS